MSFEKDADQANTNEDDKLTFNVGERTFDADSATTKIQAADEHIAKLEAENAAFKLQIEQSTSIDEALKELREKDVTSQNSQTNTDTTVVSEEQIGEIANKKIADYLAAKQIEDNASAAQSLAERTYQETGSKIKAIYGDKTDEAMADKAKELGISSKELFDMAKTPATAVMLLQAMKVDATPSQSAPDSGFNLGGHTGDNEKFVDYEKPITSSTLLEALKKADATY